MSDPVSVTSGVPQESVLGPLLFLLYVNNLPNISEMVTFHQIVFVDDTNIYCSSEKLNNLESKLNCELKAVQCRMDEILTD